MDAILSAERLAAVLAYEPETGAFVFQCKRGNRAKGAVVSGSPGTHGHRYIGVDGRLHLAHRLAFLAMTGLWPVGEIDHIDGDPSNNRWVNLRDTDHRTNMQNIKRAPITNRSGLLGAHRHQGRFASKIRIAGRLVHLGCFDTAQAASEAYLRAKRTHHSGCTL